MERGIGAARDVAELRSDGPRVLGGGALAGHGRDERRGGGQHVRQRHPRGHGSAMVRDSEGVTQVAPDGDRARIDDLGQGEIDGVPTTGLRELLNPEVLLEDRSPSP